MHLCSGKSRLYCPLKMSPAMSSSSSLVLTGRMMSARSASFSSQGCCAHMNSISGCCMARTYSLPEFQQVIHDGESVQTARILAQPSAG